MKHHESGFTLVELLIVIAIIGMLGALGLTMMTGAKRDSELSECKSFMLSITAALDQYKNDRKNGAYPATSLENLPGVGKLGNRTNMGAESLFVALSAKAFGGDRPAESNEDRYANLDEDRSQTPLTIFSATDLFEFVDPWGNPLAYFNAADYADPQLRQYLATASSGGEPELVTVKPHESAKTKSFHLPSKYQLFSAGPDMQFNTEDDIGNWDLD